ncbi:MAG: hypothetical protein ACT4QF_23225 [Sporichthyaceae bacterium]
MQIERVARKIPLHGRDDAALRFWLSRPIVERIEHVEDLRAEHHGWDDGEARPGLSRVHRILRRP